MTPGRCVHGTTGGNGDVGFGMGNGAYYWPDKGQIGPHAIWMYGADTPSDLILGLGMIGATNHTHLDTVWIWDNGDDPPEPPDPPGPDGDLRYFDAAGNEQDEAWALHYFGPQNVHEPDSDSAFRLIELMEDNGPERVLQVMVIDEAGEPWPGVTVLFGSRDIDPSTIENATTWADGIARFQLTDAHLYNAPSEAHHRVAVAESDSDVCSIGQVKAKPRRHLNMVFMLRTGEPEPPPDDRLGRALEWLFSSQGRLDRAAAEQGEAMAILIELAGG